MTGDAIGRIAFLIFLLAIPIGAIFLQIHLSKKENRWLGLILPLITFAISVIAVLGMATYTQEGQTTLLEYVDGELISTIVSEGGIREAIPGAIGGVIYTFVIMNIPTIILLVIYKAVRNKQNRRHDVEKMSVQDL